jgi:hypothetical protein
MFRPGLHHRSTRGVEVDFIGEICQLAAQRSVFLYGFAKNERDNIDDRELADLKKLARHYLSYSEAQIATALMQSVTEIECDAEEEGGQEEGQGGQAP